MCDELDVAIGGASFPLRLYQFALAHSGWRHATIVTSGESFMALSAGCRQRYGAWAAYPRNTC